MNKDNMFYSVHLYSDNTCLGSFKSVEGIELEATSIECSKIIKFFDGEIYSDEYVNKNINDVELIFNFYDQNNILLNSLEGLAESVTFFSINENPYLEICAFPASSLFLRTDELRFWIERMRGLPKQYNEWSSLNKYDQETWLKVALLDKRKNNNYKPSLRIILNGKLVKDLISFLCHLGELIAGKGGYVGRSLTALEDCFSENWNLHLPEVIIWRDYEFSRNSFIKNNQQYELENVEEILANANIKILKE